MVTISRLGILKLTFSAFRNILDIDKKIIAQTSSIASKFDLPAPFVLHTDCPRYWRYHLPGESEEEFSTRLANNLENLILKEGPETIAAFIAEPVMGAGVASRSPFLKLPSSRENPSKKALFSSATLNPRSSDGSLWKRAAELHVGVASQGENASYEMPCLIIAATDDLDPYPHGNSHLHVGPTPTYIQLHGRPWHANFSGHESLPFISLFFTILGFGK